MNIRKSSISSSTEDFTEADHALDILLDEMKDVPMKLDFDDSAEEGEATRRSRTFTRLTPVQEYPDPPLFSNELRVRVSLSNIVDGSDSDLDALLEELCAAEREMTQEIGRIGVTDSETTSVTDNHENLDKANPVPAIVVETYNEDETKETIRASSATLSLPTANGPSPTILSPNTLKAEAIFTEMLTIEERKRMESVASEEFEIVEADQLNSETLKTEKLIAEILEADNLKAEEEEGRKKAEKIRTAIEKIKEASLMKMFVKVYNHEQDTTKTIVIDNTWTARDLRHKMMLKDNIKPDPGWCIAEKLPALHMARILEDGEFVSQTIFDWTRKTDNFLVFLHRAHRYALFREPHNFLASDGTYPKIDTLTEESKRDLLQEFFSKGATQVPQTEGVLWLREGQKKWVKHYFLLRPSGIYYTPKGKQKSRDMACLTTFENNNVYACINSRTSFKSPTNHAFCLKHPKVQALKSKHIYLLCAEDAQTKKHWMTVIRMAKYGYKMYEDYLITQEQGSVLSSGRSIGRTPTRSSSFAKGRELTNKLGKSSSVRSTPTSSPLLTRSLQKSSSVRSTPSSSPLLTRPLLSNKSHVSANGNNQTTKKIEADKTKENQPKDDPPNIAINSNRQIPRSASEGDQITPSLEVAQLRGPPDLSPLPPMSPPPDIAPYGERRRKERRILKRGGKDIIFADGYSNTI